MQKKKDIKTILFLTVIAALLLAPSAQARKHNNPLFQYAAGTQPIPGGCEGKLEMTHTAMIFECPAGSITVPYNSITHMEYREKISKQIRKMKLNWLIEPTSAHNKHEGFFAVLYTEKGQKHAMILRVSPETMRPYLAEIDLKTGMVIHNGTN